MTIDYKTMRIIMFPSLAVVPKAASRVPDSKLKAIPRKIWHRYQIWKEIENCEKKHHFGYPAVSFQGCIQKLLHVFPGAPFWEHGSNIIKFGQTSSNFWNTGPLDKRSPCHIEGDKVGSSVPIYPAWEWGKSPHESEASSMQLAEQSEVGCGLMMVLVPCWEGR